MLYPERKMLFPKGKQSQGWGGRVESPAKIKVKNEETGTSLVAQWLRICLPMQGTWVRALVREDPT